MKLVSIVWAVVLLSGCASQAGYHRLPREYTEIPAQMQESYLIEALPAFGGPFAYRFDFTDSSGATTVEIHSFSYSGRKTLEKKHGAEANRLRTLFRDFDWNAIGPPKLEQAYTAMYLDGIEIVLKAKTAHAYREAHGGLAECKPLGDLFDAVLVVSEDSDGRHLR